MKKIYLVSACLVILIGLLHTFYGIFSGKEFNSELLWFISTGLLIIVVGLLNLKLIKKGVGGFDFRSVQIFNLLSTVFFALLVMADPMPVGFVLLVTQIINSLLSWNVLRKNINCCNKLSVNIK